MQTNCNGRLLQQTPQLSAIWTLLKMASTPSGCWSKMHPSSVYKAHIPNRRRRKVRLSNACFLLISHSLWRNRSILRAIDINYVLFESDMLMDFLEQIPCLHQIAPTFALSIKILLWAYRRTINRIHAGLSASELWWARSIIHFPSTSHKSLVNQTHLPSQ